MSDATITVTQVRSAIGTKPKHRGTLRALYLDLSAVAKGYAVDQVSALLHKHGATASMVEIGGEVVCRGRKPDGSPWRIGLEKPDTRGRALQAVIVLVDEAVATSGDYRNFFQSGSARFSHTINPKSGRPVEHQLATVSVRAESCMEADAWATAILVMGPVDGYNWAEDQGVSALLIERKKESFVERATTAWSDSVSAD